MNREQKAAAIAQIAAQIEESDAIFAVDYRGLSVTQMAELRGRLRDAEATFKVVKNSLTERAAEQSGADSLNALLIGPTALTFVRGDVAVAAKAIADYARATQLLPFKGGLMDGQELDVEQLRSLSRLPARDVLYGQLVGVVASPVSGLVRTLGALLGGLAVALGQVREKKESGEIPAGTPPADAAETPEAAQADAATESDGGTEPSQVAEQAAASDAEAAPEPEPEPEAPPEAEPEAELAEQPEARQAEAPPEAEPEAEAAEEPAGEQDAEASAEPEPAAEAAAPPADEAREEGQPTGGAPESDEQADAPAEGESADQSSTEED
jgi:large subunit ribosomal protein L10